MRDPTGEISLAFDTFGESGARPLLLVSGLGTPMTRWTSGFCAQLADRGFYVIRFDNRDCGGSTHLNQIKPAGKLRLLLSRLLRRPVLPPYTLDDMAADTARLLDNLGVRSAHVVGRSMGGLIAQRLAYRHPDRVRSLTLLMSTSGNPALPLPDLSVLRLMLKRVPRPERNLEAYLRHRIAYTRAIGSQQFPLSEDEIRQRVLADLESAGFNPGSGRRQLMAIIAAGDQRPLIRALHQPALVIHGDADPLVPLACGIDIQRSLPGARLKVIPGMGHSLHPVFFADILEGIVSIAEVADPPTPPSQSG